MIPKEELDLIFSNIEEIVKVHEELLKKLKARLGVVELTPDRNKGTVKGKVKMSHLNRSVSYHVGDIFFEMSDSFVAYDKFCANFKKSTDAIQRCKKIEAFKNFLQTQSALPACQLLTLRDFLIKPIQRICKYPILFADLATHTPPSHKDYKVLVLCQEKFEAITTQINMSKKDAENIQNLIRIETMMTGLKVKLAVAGRDYVHEGPLVKTDSATSSKADMRYVFLFNDILICSKVRKSFSKKAGEETTTYAYEMMLPMKIISLKSLDDQPERRHGFQLTRSDTKKICIFYARSKVDKDIWMRKLQKRIEKSVEKDKKRRELRQEQNAQKESPTGGGEGKSGGGSVIVMEGGKRVSNYGSSAVTETITTTDVPTLQVEVYKWKKAALNQKDIIGTLSKYIANEAEQKKELLQQIEQLKQQLAEEKARHLELQEKNKGLEGKLRISQEIKKEEGKDLKVKRLEEVREKWKKEFEEKEKEKKEQERKEREEREKNEREAVESGRKRASVALYDQMSRGAQSWLGDTMSASAPAVPTRAAGSKLNMDENVMSKDAEYHLKRGSVALWDELKRGASKIVHREETPSETTTTTTTTTTPKATPALVNDEEVYVSGDEWIEEEAYKAAGRRGRKITITLKKAPLAEDDSPNGNNNKEKQQQQQQTIVVDISHEDEEEEDEDESEDSFWSEDDFEDDEPSDAEVKSAEYLLQKFYSDTNTPTTTATTTATTTTSTTRTTEEVNLFTLLAEDEASVAEQQATWSIRKPTTERNETNLWNKKMGQRLTEEELVMQQQLGALQVQNPGLLDASSDSAGNGASGKNARNSIMFFFGTK